MLGGSALLGIQGGNGLAEQRCGHVVNTAADAAGDTVPVENTQSDHGAVAVLSVRHSARASSNTKRRPRPAHPIFACETPVECVHVRPAGD